MDILTEAPAVIAQEIMRKFKEEGLMVVRRDLFEEITAVASSYCPLNLDAINKAEELLEDEK